jgi:acyl-CoA reductase-like NAD-dependent aldehyde dehydrogenase
LDKGAKLVHGGKKVKDSQGHGRFYEPTIITNVSGQMRMTKERKIGPIIGIQKVDSPAMARKIINE